MKQTITQLEKTDFPPLTRGKVETIQVNLGYRCNQSCVHCHVNAGPKRTENMGRETIDQLIQYLKVSDFKTLDLTGGAPELNRNFRYLVRHAREMGLHIIDRCNLTILEEPGQEDLAQFLAENKVEVVASMPCYLQDNVDKQRGKGVFDGSIRGLKRLNELGYGKEGSGLELNLMYNPQGPVLPPEQTQLEADYHQHLLDEHGIVFNNLYTLTNMPIQRFGSMLISKGQLETYMQLLRDNFKAENLDKVMCRHMISIDWQGYLNDCDFNQMLKLPSQIDGRPKSHLTDVMNTKLEGLPIVVKDHCYGCAAGQGSSCGGALD